MVQTRDNKAKKGSSKTRGAKTEQVEAIGPTRRKTKATAKDTGGTAGMVERRYQMIAEAAYFLAERRGYVGGSPLGDWLSAEAEIDARLSRAGG